MSRDGVTASGPDWLDWLDYAAARPPAAARRRASPLGLSGRRAPGGRQGGYAAALHRRGMTTRELARWRFMERAREARGMHWRPLTQRGRIEGYTGHVPGAGVHGVGVPAGAFVRMRRAGAWLVRAAN